MSSLTSKPGANPIDAFDQTLTGDSCEHENPMNKRTAHPLGGSPNSGSVNKALKLLAAAGLLGAGAKVALQRQATRRQFLGAGLAGGAALLGSSVLTPNNAWALPPELAPNTLPIEIVQRGGAQFPFWLRYPGRFPNGTIAAPAQAWGPIANPIALPPQIPGSAVPAGYGMVPEDPTNPASELTHFIEKFGDRMMVIVSNHGTNSHDIGRRKAVQGSNADIFPGSNALFASTFGGAATMPYIVNTANNYPGGVVAPTDLQNPSGLRKLALPNLANPQNPNTQILVPSMDAMLLQTRVDALTAMVEDPLALPALRKHAEFRLAAEGAREEIAAILDLIDGQGNMNGMISTARIAMAGQSNGLVSAAFLSDGRGYDTHGQMDGGQQMNNAQAMMEAINEVMYYGANNTNAAGEAAPVSPLITVKTDFGRRPVNGDASAHWVVGMTVIIGDAVKAYLDDIGIEGPISIGEVNDNLELVGNQQVLIEDVVTFQRQLLGLPVVGPWTISGISAPNAIDNIVNNLPLEQ